MFNKLEDEFENKYDFSKTVKKLWIVNDGVMTTNDGEEGTVNPSKEVESRKAEFIQQRFWKINGEVLKIRAEKDWSLYLTNSNLDKEECYFTDLTTLSKYKKEERVDLEEKAYSIWEKYLFDLITSDVFEDGLVSKSEEFMVKTVDKDTNKGMEWINKFFYKYFDNDHVLIGVLHAISHIDFLKVKPNGQIMALACLSNKNGEVSEFAVKAFENWENYDGVRFLKTVKMNEPWLQEYVNDVIRDLEEIHGNEGTSEENSKVKMGSCYCGTI